MAVVTQGIKVNLLDGVTKYVLLIETSGNRALDSSSSSPLFGAAVAYKCHNIPQPGRERTRCAGIQYCFTSVFKLESNKQILRKVHNKI